MGTIDPWFFTQNDDEDLENIHKVDAIVVILGQDQDVVYSKSTALQVLY